MGISKQVFKDWGMEVTIVNNEKYCYKVLSSRGGKWSSYGLFHMHLDKDETFIIQQGVLQLEVADFSKGVHENCVGTLTLRENDQFRIFPRTPHRFKSYGGDECIFVEVSTTDREEDSIRGTLEELYEFLKGC